MIWVNWYMKVCILQVNRTAEVTSLHQLLNKIGFFHFEFSVYHILVQWFDIDDRAKIASFFGTKNNELIHSASRIEIMSNTHFCCKAVISFRIRS